MSYVSENWRGLAALFLGVGTVMACHYFLDTCADTGTFATLANGSQVHMVCSWSERATEGVGGLIAIMGLISLFMKQSARALSLAMAASGVLMILIPLVLIGTCKSPMMACNLSLKPGVLVLSGLITVVGLVGAGKLGVRMSQAKVA